MSQKSKIQWTDAGDMDEWPEHLRVRQFPGGAAR